MAKTMIEIANIKHSKQYTAAVFVGDVCIADEGCETSIAGKYFVPWSPLQKVFSQSSLIIANLECAFTDEKKGLPYKWANLKTSHCLHGILEGLGVAILGNNHIGDFGTQGVIDTLALLDSKGILHIGYGATIDEAVKPVFVNLAGKTLGIVSLCCPTTNSENLATHQTPGVAPLGMAILQQAVYGAKERCDALVVYLHWGCEWVHDPAPDQLRLARHAVDCGADAVIACHSHTIQSYEQYKGRWIFYGLGNYLFNAGQAQLLRADGSIELIPIELKQENRESLAVGFRISPDHGEGRLTLTRIQPMCYGEDWTPHPIAIEDLSFDLAAANRRLRKYIGRNSRFLNTRNEPEFRARLRNGVLAYYYSEDSINTSAWQISVFRKPRALAAGALRRARSLLKGVSSV